MGTPLTDPILSAFSSSVASGRPSTTSMRLMRQFSPEPSSNHSCVKVMLTHGGSVLYCTRQMAENGTQLVQDIQRHSYRYYPDRRPLSAAAQAPYHGVRARRHATLPAGYRRDRRGLLHGDPRPTRESGIREPLPRLPTLRVRCRQHRRVRSFDKDGAGATADGEKDGGTRSRLKTE